MTRILVTTLLGFLIFTGCTSSEKADSSLGAETATPGWEVIGPGGGGTIYIPTISPGDSSNVFVRCDMTGAYVTENGGDSWRMFNLRGVVRDFEFDPQAPETIYASNSGLYRSDDRGRRWKLIYPSPEDVTEEVMTGDHASHRFRTESGMPDSQIVKVRVDPSDSNHLFIGLSPSRTSSQPARVLESTDKGTSWHEVAQVPGRQILGIFPGSWVGRSDEIVVVSDSGAVGVSLEGKDVRELQLPVAEVLAAEGGTIPGGSYLYILSGFSNEGGVLGGGVYRSSDFGTTWE